MSADVRLGVDLRAGTLLSSGIARHRLGACELAQLLESLYEHSGVCLVTQETVIYV